MPRAASRTTAAAFGRVDAAQATGDGMFDWATAALATGNVAVAWATATSTARDGEFVHRAASGGDGATLGTIEWTTVFHPGVTPSGREIGGFPVATAPALEAVTHNLMLLRTTMETEPV